ncbi:hypothetical protein J2S70_001178 [Trueperella bonasi]|uniref:Uncharacterized protein n=1 Tax=Trueperella bonasi TaxID=312286 RepID=A0ABT9NGT2_9ACTO|nr:hypothetical protein [Trueperella bonasi]MDP9806596.1 hypothetical protein [Trueperella bonasi]
MGNGKHWGADFYGGKEAEGSDVKAAKAAGEQSADQLEEVAEQAIESEAENPHEPSHWGIGVYGNKDQQSNEEKQDQ